jgi:hypothetical protein
MGEKALKGDIAHAEAVVKADQEKRQTVIKEWDVTQDKPLENGPIIPQTPDNEARIKAMRTAPFEPMEHDPSIPALRVVANEPTPPTVGERIAEVKAARENTDAGQRATAENTETTDRKAETDDRAQARNDADRQRHYDNLKQRDGEAGDRSRDKGGGISY